MNRKGPPIASALLLLSIYSYSLSGCRYSSSPRLPESSYAIPKQTDWVDKGTILKAGLSGEWDYLLWGGFTGSIIKRNDTYYLYYQGASGYRTDFDETVSGRAIGVATSPDGVHFMKYSNNPVVTWAPNDGAEEGAASGAAAVDSNGQILLFYGANTLASRTRVHADGRLAVSEDGMAFSDHGVILDRRSEAIWGSGDELFPVIAFQHSTRWFLYYIPNGTLQTGKLGVAWGEDLDDLSYSSKVYDYQGKAVTVWGMAGHARVDTNTYVLFLNDVRKSIMTVRVVSIHSPAVVSEPIASYRFPEVKQATVLLDEQEKKWLMYYRGERHYGLKEAVAVRPELMQGNRE